MPGLTAAVPICANPVQQEHIPQVLTQLPAKIVPHFMSAQTKHVRGVPPKEAAILPKQHHAAQDITSAVQTASPAHRERIPKAVRLPLVPAAPLCTPAQAAIHAPAVQQRELAPDLIPDRGLIPDRDPTLGHLQGPDLLQDPAVTPILIARKAMNVPETVAVSANQDPI